MTRIYRRTENGTETLISVPEALAEVNDAMMGGSHKVETMSSGHGNHQIEYKDGRMVSLVEIEETIPVKSPIVVVKGRRYVVSSITPARPRTEGVKSWIPQAYVSYWTERNGQAFGATRHASASNKPGTIGRAIWDAVN